jgi:hypothetical protein
MKINATRRNFLGGCFALGITPVFANTGASLLAKRWYKGNLHMHTFWSDGRAFPEEAVGWYKSHGYNFIGLSDHNIFQDNDNKWVTVEDPKKKIRGISSQYAKRYLAAFPNAQTRKTKKGATQVKLKTYKELAATYDSAGEFLLLPAVEATRSTMYSSGKNIQLHMNYINLPKLLPSYQKKGFVRAPKNKNISKFIAENADETKSLAATLSRPYIFFLNHPMWVWYDLGPEVLIDNPDVRFFEVCNCGSDYKPIKGFPTDGFDTDRFWDVVNAFRARRGTPLLYGVGTDDTHYYSTEKRNAGKPGNSWSLVRAHTLSPSALIDAMMAGDFVTCENLEPEDVSFDRAKRQLNVSVAAKTGVARTIHFIVSKKDFSEKPIKTVTVKPVENRSNRFERTVNVYDHSKIGCIVKTVKGNVGEAISASYTLASDDLYVRARIEESGQPICTEYLHPQGKFVAWTQPYN